MNKSISRQLFSLKKQNNLPCYLTKKTLEFNSLVLFNQENTRLQQSGSEHLYISSFFERSSLNPLNATPTKWSNTLKQFVGNLPTICLSVFDNFVGLVVKGLKYNNTKGNGFPRIQIKSLQNS